MADARNQELYCTKLIRLIEQNKCLYDTSLPDYAVKSAQEDAWAKVADELRSSVSECKDRWRNIRNAYLRHIRNNIRSESGAKAKKSYYLSDYLTFLTPFLKSRTHSSYFIIDENQSEYEATNDIKDGHFLHDHIHNDTVPCEDIKVEPDYFDSPGDETHTPYYYNLNKKRKLEANHYDYDDGCIPIGRSDPDLDFLKSLVPDFRLLSAAQKRKVKIGILKLIDDELSSP